MIEPAKKSQDLQHSVAEPQPKPNIHHGDTESRRHGKGKLQATGTQVTGAEKQNESAANSREWARIEERGLAYNSIQ